MIVQPNFPEHWKTRRLVEIASDESAPLAVIRLWAHCQHSKRHQFSDMTPAQLASICRWGSRKPACHVALTKAGFVDRLKPKGFAAHQWNEHNAQLIQKWHAGEKGGRPPKSENTNELGQNEEPDDNRPITGTKPDKTRPDQTKSEMIKETKPNQTPSNAPPQPDNQTASISSRDLSGSFKAQMEIMRPASGIAASKTALSFLVPSLVEVEDLLRLCFKGADKYAEPFLKAMTKSQWRHEDGTLVQNWRAMARAYAEGAARPARDVGTTHHV
jgi:hypothetical protein